MITYTAINWKRDVKILTHEHVEKIGFWFDGQFYCKKEASIHISPNTRLEK